MGLIDDKKNVFTTIGAYSSLAEETDLSDLTNIFTSINNKDDVIPFLIDILKVVVGTTALEQLTGQLFTNFIDEIEPTIKDTVKKQLIQYDAGTLVSETSFFNTGISIDAKNIDIYGKLKTNPGGDIGSLLYDTSVENFDSKAYEAISANGSDVVYNNLLINYNSTTDKFKFKPNISSSSNVTIGEWFNDFIDDSVFINKKEFVSNILNNIYGTVTANQNKSVDAVRKELEVNKQINQLLEGNDDFEISEDNYAELNKKAEEMVSGIINYDMGCGLVSAELSLSGLTDTLNTISGFTDSNLVGNAINNTINKSFSGLNVNEIGEENQETIKNGFFGRLIEFLRLELAKILVASPQARMLLAISSSFKNNGIPEISDPREDLKNFKIYIKCVTKEALAYLHEFIFNLIVGFLISLLDPIIRRVIREKINQYINVIKSLISSRL